MSDNSDFRSDLEMLKYFQDEFQYRHKHFWDIAIKLFILDIIVLLLPVSTEILGINLILIKSEYIAFFSLFGVLIAVLTYCILTDEAKKISAVNKAKYRINRQMKEKYQYVNYVGNMADKRKQLAFSLPKYILAVEIIMAVMVAVYCLR